MRRLVQTLLAASVALPLAAQTGTPASVHPDVVEMSGVIVRIHLNPGEGTPYLEVKSGDKTAIVHLGPMRFLIEENFAPKTGQEVTLKGYKAEDYVVAIEVTLPAEKKTLRLRDDDGRPLWRGGRRRQGAAR